jgi:hypothetical protein
MAAGRISRKKAQRAQKSGQKRAFCGLPLPFALIFPAALNGGRLAG